MRFFSALLAVGPMLALPLHAADVYRAPSPELLPAAKVMPRTGSRAKWLWFQAPKVLPRKTAYFRKKLTIPDKPVAAAWFYAGLDDSGEIWLNGAKLRAVPFRQPDFQVKFQKFEVTGLLKKGENLLAAVARNDAASGGMILFGEIRFQDGSTLPLRSDKSFKACEKAPENWMKRDCDDSAWRPAMEHGDAMSQPWYSVSDVFNLFTGPEEKEAWRLAREKAVAPPPPANAPDLRAKIVWQNDMAALDINGTVTPPVTFLLGRSPWTPEVADIIQKAGQAGLHIFEYQPASNRMFRASGDYDFEFLDQDMRRILALDPDAVLIVGLRFDLFSEWMRQHPDDLIGYATGPATGGGDLARHRSPSMASEAFRAEMKKFTAAFVEHLKKHTWFKRVIGMRVSHGVFSEWHYYGMEKDMPDTGKAMTRRFRAYLREKYPDDAALQKAWRDPAVTLATATVPGVAERRGQNRFLRDPASADRKVIDYYHCHSEVVAETLLGMAATVKEHAPKLLVGAYYGYVFGMPYPSEGLTLELDRVLADPAIDFLSAPHCYEPESRYVGGDGLARTLVSTFRRYGKLHIYEADTRTHLAGNVGLGNARTLADSLANLKRDYANAWLEGCAVQFLEFAARTGKRCWFNDPAILTLLHDGLGVWRELYALRDNAMFPAEIAAVYDPAALIEHGYPEAADQRLMSQALGSMALHGLRRSGFPFDLMSPADFLASRRDYRTVVFLNPFRFPAPLRQALKARVRRPGVTAVWCYAPGLVTEQGWSEAAMTELTGIDLAVSPERNSLAIRLADGAMMEYRDRSRPLAEAPRVRSRDGAAQVLGRYVEGKEAALVRKRLADGSTAVFCGMPVTDGAVWGELFAAAGCHRYAASGTVLITGARGLAVHTPHPGAIEITLPRAVRSVRDLFGSPVLLNGGKQIILKSKGPETWLLMLE